MKIHPVRIFKLRGQDKVEIHIAPAMPDDDQNQNYFCTCSITGLGDHKERRIMGIDGVQAHHLALIYAATTLYSSDEYARGELTWMAGNTPFDLGLPMAESTKAHMEALQPALNARQES